MFNNQYTPQYYNSNYQMPTDASKKKMIILLSIAGVILIVSSVFLSILLNAKVLTCTQTIGQGANTQTLELTYEYRNGNLSSGKMHSVFKIEDEFTDEYVASIKSTVEDDDSYESYVVKKINEHELTIDAKISPEYTRQATGDNYESTKDHLIKTGMICN